MKRDTSEEGNAELEGIAIKMIQMEHKKLPIKNEEASADRKTMFGDGRAERDYISQDERSTGQKIFYCPEDIGWEIPKSDQKLESYIFIKLNKQMCKYIKVPFLKQQCQK